MAWKFFRSSLNSRQMRTWSGATAATLMAVSTAVFAQGGAGSDPGAVVQQWVDQSLQVAASRDSVFGKLRPEVEVGQLDARLRLAPCNQIEAYMPPGARLWGRTRVGLRCIEGATRWNVTVPVTVRAWGPAWAVKRDIAAGTSLGAGDLMQVEADWASEMSPVVAVEGAWIGQVATRNLATGHVLRQASLKAATVFQSGAQVRVVAVGRGFSVTADGQAVTAGALGQLARVRMDNGRVLSGTVVDTNTVRVEI